MLQFDTFMIIDLFAFLKATTSCFLCHSLTTSCFSMLLLDNFWFLFVFLYVTV